MKIENQDFLRKTRLLEEDYITKVRFLIIEIGPKTR